MGLIEISLDEICRFVRVLDIVAMDLYMVHGSRDVIIHVGENRNKYEMFEKSEILLRKYKDLLVRVREMGKKVCINGILPRLR